MSNYGFDESVKADGKSWFPAGINENTELSAVAYEKKDTYESLNFTFKHENGSEFTHREFPIKEGEEYTQELYKKFNARMKHILTKFVTEDEAKIAGATSFADFAAKFVGILGNKFAGVKFRLITVYNPRNYLKIPNFVPFMELMTVPKEQSKLKLTSYHKVEKTQADAEPATTDGGPSGSGAGSDDLPF